MMIEARDVRNQVLLVGDLVAFPRGKMHLDFGRVERILPKTVEVSYQGRGGSALFIHKSLKPHHAVVLIKRADGQTS